ncbi:zinc finger protein 569-like isoform X1 [Varroa destructor]|uniref:C2H2-type domain-containing protein n=2 Tax=Varroa destructor TaxID=109461 RepID=A0A7M7K689_VARDE|nr:zinc finger protein 569-like isoform X1 [Varroa destructor]XP_022658292.1 zinc finger protein 569-like isoform X1 [Varroa destructor]
MPKIRQVSGVSGLGETADPMEFDPEFFGFEIVDDIPILHCPAVGGDVEKGTSPKKKQQLSRRRIVQQFSAVISRANLTSNGISQSGLVRWAAPAKKWAVATKKFTCGFAGCGKVFARKQSLHEHLGVHSDERPYKCKSCGKTFKRASHLIAHRRLHTTVKPFLYQVNGTAFAHSRIIKHATNECRPFKCPHCLFEAARQDAVDARVREAHVSPAVDNSNCCSPLDCSICIYREVIKQDIDEHMSRSHVHLRKFSCPYCEYRAHTKSRLDTHLLLHTGEKPHSCSVCRRRFRQKRQMETHYARQHQDRARTADNKRKIVAKGWEIHQELDIGPDDMEIEYAFDEHVEPNEVISTSE